MMVASSESRPFDFLYELDRKSKKRSGGMPAYQQQGENWTGVLFCVGDDNLLLPMSQVQEIVLVPQQITRVPGTPQWVLGLSNLRGSLLTVIDLKGLVEDKLEVLGEHKQRLLVISYEGFEIGLLASSVSGMKHYLKTDASVERPNLSEQFQHYVQESFQTHDDHHGVLNIEQLLADDKFQHVSLHQ